MARTPANRYLYNLVASIVAILAPSAAQGGVVYVDAVEGDDATGSYAKPFETPGAAKTFASAGDTIVVRPGTYAVTASLLKAGVNWHLMAGSTITRLINTAVFDDGGVAITSRVTGSGTIGGAGNAIKMAAASNLDIDLEAISCVDVVTVTAAAGTVRLRVNKVTATGALVTVSGGSPLIYVDAQSVVGGTGGVLGGVAPIIYVRAQLLASGSAYTFYPSGAGRLYVDFDAASGCYFENAGALSETYVTGRRHANDGGYLADSSAAGGFISYAVKQAEVSNYAFPALRCGPGVLRIGAGSRIVNLTDDAAAGGVNCANNACLIVEGGVSIVTTNAGSASLVGAVTVKIYGVAVATYAKEAGITISFGTLTVNAAVT